MAAKAANLDDLVNGLNALRRQNQWLRVLLGITFFIAACAMLVACAPRLLGWLFRSHTIEANKIVLESHFEDELVGFRNPAGKIGGVRDDYGKLAFYQLSENGTDWTRLSLGDPGVMIELYKNKKPIAGWTLTENGTQFEKLGHQP